MINIMTIGNITEIKLFSTVVLKISFIAIKTANKRIASLTTSGKKIFDIIQIKDRIATYRET